MVHEPSSEVPERPAGDSWISVKDRIPEPDSMGRERIVLAWGSIYNGSNLGPPGYLLATVAEHPTSGPFWRAHGWSCEVSWWQEPPEPPVGERVLRSREPDTGAC